MMRRKSTGSPQVSLLNRIFWYGLLVLFSLCLIAALGMAIAMVVDYVNLRNCVASGSCLGGNASFNVLNVSQLNANVTTTDGILTINGISPNLLRDFGITAGSNIQVIPGTNAISIGTTSAVAFTSLAVSGATTLGTGTSCSGPLLPSCYDISGTTCSSPISPSCIQQSLTLPNLVVTNLTILGNATIIPSTNQTSAYIDFLTAQNTVFTGPVTCNAPGTIQQSCINISNYVCTAGQPISESCIPDVQIMSNLTVTDTLTVNNVICNGPTLPPSCIGNVFDPAPIVYYGTGTFTNNGGDNTTTVGPFSSSLGCSICTVAGYATSAQGSFNTAIGTSSVIPSTSSRTVVVGNANNGGAGPFNVVIGSGSTGDALGFGVVIGQGSHSVSLSNAYQNVLIGRNATCELNTNVVIGTNCYGGGRTNVVIGYTATTCTTCFDNIIIGDFATAAFTSQHIVIGSNSISTSTAYSTTLGSTSSNSGNNAILLGSNSIVSNDFIVAAGSFVRGSGSFSVLLGLNASDAGITKSVVLGTFTQPTDAAHAFTAALNTASVSQTAGTWGVTLNNNPYQIPIYASLSTFITTTGGTTTLTLGSIARKTIFLGTTTETVTLPVAATLDQGFELTIVNDSTGGAVTVQTSGGTTMAVLASNPGVPSPASAGTFICKNPAGGTGAASWIYTN